MSVPGSYWTLADSFRFEDEIKKSRFIACAARATTPDEALAFLDSIREHKATHHCFAYRIGELYRFSDDGEPGGTAGRPILAAIEGEGLDQVMVVVIRYFGGTKLGAGGLVRAYGNTAAECLRQAPRLEVRPIVRATIRAPFEFTGILYSLIDKEPVTRRNESYTPDGIVLELEMEAQHLEHFAQAVRDATRGQLHLES